MDYNQYVEYLKDSDYIPDFHYQLESSFSFIKMITTQLLFLIINSLHALHLQSNLALILKFSTTIKLHCKLLAGLIKRKNIYIQLLHFCIALSRLGV